MYGLNITFFLILNINKDIIPIYNNKDIKLFRKDFINIALEICRSIDQLTRHYLILEMIISSPKSYFLLISFANSYPVIGTCEVKLGKPPGLSQPI